MNYEFKRECVRYPVRFLTKVDFVAYLNHQQISGLQAIAEARFMSEKGLGINFQSTLKPVVGGLIQLGIDKNLHREDSSKFIVLTAEIVWSRSNQYGLRIFNIEGRSKDNYASVIQSLALTDSNPPTLTTPFKLGA